MWRLLVSAVEVGPIISARLPVDMKDGGGEMGGKSCSCGLDGVKPKIGGQRWRDGHQFEGRLIGKGERGRVRESEA